MSEFRKAVEELADQAGSFTASPAHVFRELRAILNRYPEPEPKHAARPPHPNTMAGRK